MGNDKPTPLPSEKELAKIRIIAKAAFQKFEPFLAQFASTRELKIIEGSMCFTDGKRIWLGYDAIQKYPRGHVFLFSHELWHIALNHLERFKALYTDKSEHILYNILTDCKVNEIIHKSINLSCGEWNKYENDCITNGTINNSLGQILTAGWQTEFVNNDSADEQFRRLKPFLNKEISKKSKYTLIESPGELGKQLTEEEKEEISREIAKSIQNAKLRGTTGGSLIEELQELWTTPTVPWKKILSNSIRNRLQNTKSWSKFNKRSMF